MNEPHENLDHDPFADDARARSPKPSARLRRDIPGRRRTRRRRRGLAVLVRRRPCPDSARGPLREWS